MFFRSSTRSSPTLSLALLCGLLTILCAAGGASRGDVLGQVVVRAAAAGALVLAILLTGRPVIGSAKPVFVLVLAAIGLALLQLVPLPPELWLRLPGRAVFAGADMAFAGGTPWRPWAISPGFAVNAATSLIVPLATLVLVAGLSGREEQKLLGLLLCLVVASSLAGVLQFSGRDFANSLINHERGETTGFFANRNHFALFLAQGCLLVAGWAFARGQQSQWRGPAGVGLILLFLLTILASGSRAGLLLGILSFFIFVGLSYRGIRAKLDKVPRWVTPIVIAGIGLIVALSVFASFAAGRAVSIDRAFATDTAQDIRHLALPTVLMMIKLYFPFGAGFGSFDAVFRLNEPLQLLRSTYFNHAHNDFLEITLDAGLPGLLLILAAVGWWTLASLRAWRGHSMLPKLGSAMIFLVMVASLVDYPARTPMIMATTTIAAVWLSRPSDSHDASALRRWTQHLWPSSPSD